MTPNMFALAPNMSHRYLWYYSMKANVRQTQRTPAASSKALALTQCPITLHRSIEDIYIIAQFSKGTWS